MRLISNGMSLIVAAALAGCGGGGNDTAAPPQREASTATFAVKSAMVGIYATGLNLNLSGRDNGIPVQTVFRDDYYNWSGTFSLSSRVVTPENRISNCTDATTLVDIKITLTRARDGYRMQEAATFGYGADYKPICASLLDGHFWTWNLSQPLPASSGLRGNISGVEFAGTVSRTADPLDIDASLTSLVGLDADTKDSAFLTFLYNVTPAPQGSMTLPYLPFRMFGEGTEFRFRIDPTGKFLGFQYVRTGLVPDPNFSSPVTVILNSQ